MCLRTPLVLGEEDMDMAGTAVTVPHCCNEKRVEPKANLSVYQAIFVPTLTYGHEVLVMTERIKGLDPPGGGR